MILDVLQNADRYIATHPLFAKAIDFLKQPDLMDLPVGRHEIDEDRIYAIIAREPGRKKDSALLEIHRNYIDIQLILDGEDQMGWKPQSACTKPSEDYDPERDIQFFKDEPDVWATVKPGMFAVFFPEDAHMPLIGPVPIHKVIVKVIVTPI